MSFTCMSLTHNPVYTKYKHILKPIGVTIQWLLVADFYESHWHKHLSIQTPLDKQDMAVAQFYLSFKHHLTGKT